MSLAQILENAEFTAELDHDNLAYLEGMLDFQDENDEE